MVTLGLAQGVQTLPERAETSASSRPNHSAPIGGNLKC